MAAMQTTAIRASSRPYSARVAPSSLRVMYLEKNLRVALRYFFTDSSPGWGGEGGLGTQHREPVPSCALDQGHSGWRKERECRCRAIRLADAGKSAGGARRRAIDDTSQVLPGSCISPGCAASLAALPAAC